MQAQRVQLRQVRCDQRAGRLQRLRQGFWLLATGLGQLRLAAARSIYGDAFFARYANRALPPIHIIVENGKIILEGAVANPLERQLAETMVRSRVLSLGVVNHLTVDTETQSG